MLDRVNVQEVFESRFKGFAKLCAFSALSVRQAVRTALEARSEAVRSQDVIWEGSWLEAILFVAILVVQAQSKQLSSVQVGVVPENGPVKVSGKS